MTGIHDLHGIEVEHLLGDTSGPLVKIRCHGSGHILIGQVDPAAARQIAAHLTEAAARAEYESDLYTTMRAAQFDDTVIGAIFHLVRQGEANRLDNQGETPT